MKVGVDAKSVIVVWPSNDRPLLALLVPVQPCPPDTGLQAGLDLQGDIAKAQADLDQIKASIAFTRNI